MKKTLVLAIGFMAVFLWATSDLLARGGRGGGGRGGGGMRGGGGGMRGGGGGGYRGGGGGYRGGMNRSPSMSRPTARPSSINRPNTNRYAGRTARPSYGNLPTPGGRPGAGAGARPGGGTRPGPGARPGTGNIANRPAGGRPNVGARPGAGTLPSGGRPSGRDLENFLNLPTQGGGLAGGARPSTRPSRPGAGLAGGALVGGAAAAFLNDDLGGALGGGSGRPGTGDIASTLPAGPGGGRPGDGARPGDGRPDVGRPGQPGQRPGDIGQPGRPGDRPGDIGRPGQPGDRPGDIGRPGQPGDRPGDIGRPGRPGDRPGDLGRPGRPGDRDFAQNLPSRIRDREDWQNWRQEHRDNIQDWWQNNAGDFDNWFDDAWWNDSDLDWPYYPGFGYWGWGTWAGLAGWVDYGWSDPVYYNYGENVYYDDGSVYYGEQPVCTQAEYAEQAEAIATNVPEIEPAAEDWMSLGVFALTSDGPLTGAEPTMYLQLAVSKQGVISGTFQNTATDTVQAIEGMVDKQTQRAAWTTVGKSRPLMETGIGNLTQDTTPALIHFADGSTQQWLLVRMEEPAAAKAEGANN